MEPRRVTVHDLTITDFDPSAGTFDLSIRCSGGVYVRTLIVEIARQVGSAAHMTALERTRHGPFANEADAQAARAAGVPTAGVCPVTEAELGDALRLIAAIDEADAALREHVPPPPGGGEAAA